MKVIGKIYVLKDPETLEIRYVGQTIQRLDRRMSTHIYDALYRNNGNYNIPKCNWFRKLFKQDKYPIIECIEEVERHILDEREIYWIKYFKNNGCKLLNLTDGGNGVCKNIQEYHKREKPVFAINRKTLERLEFKSTEEASILTCTKRRNIPKAIHINGEANGYYWSYENFPENWIAPKNSHFTNVILTDVKSNKENSFYSIKDAILFTNGTVKSNKNGANYALKHMGKEYRGYFWNYINPQKEVLECIKLIQDGKE